MVAEETGQVSHEACLRIIELGRRLYNAVAVRISRGEVQRGEAACALALALVLLHRQTGASAHTLAATIQVSERIIDDMRAQIDAEGAN